MKDRIESIAEAIRNSRRVIISTHKSPEGDAIGSMLALLIALRDMGKTCHAVLSDDVPAGLKFLPLADQVRKEAEGPLSKYDLGLIVDCTELVLVDPHRPPWISNVQDVNNHTPVCSAERQQVRQPYVDVVERPSPAC